MFYQFVLVGLGPHGRWLLDYIVEHQLIIMSVVFTVFLLKRGLEFKEDKS